MLSTTVSVLLLVVMLSIIVSQLISVWREHQRSKRRLTTMQASYMPVRLPSHPVTAMIRMQDGILVDLGKTESSSLFVLPSSGYTRRRTLVSLGFLIMVLLTLFLQDGLAGGTLQNLSKGVTSTFLSYAQPTDLNPAAHPVPSTASSRLIRIDSGARNQYYTDYQWGVWAYSSCSGIAMEMVMNAYGHHFIAADVLQEELNLGVWSVSVGLLRDEGVAMTASSLGFNASLSHSQSLQDVITTSNKGTPVIVSVRDSYYFPAGHIFVVRGGDSQYVYIADSSPQNFQHMSYSMFLGMWQGFSAVLTPR